MGVCGRQTNQCQVTCKGTRPNCGSTVGALLCQHAVLPIQHRPLRFALPWGHDHWHLMITDHSIHQSVRHQHCRTETPTAPWQTACPPPGPSDRSISHCVPHTCSPDAHFTAPPPDTGTTDLSNTQNRAHTDHNKTESNKQTSHPAPCTQPPCTQLNARQDSQGCPRAVCVLT